MREYLQHLSVERGLAGNTVESYERDLRRYAGWLAARGTSTLSDVRETDISGFIIALRTGDDEHPPLAVSSAGRAVVAVRGLHAFAHTHGLTGDDAAREVAP
ncbi:MAG: site-specific integrase, partial [Streptosporangiaceae bacterium]